MRSFGKGRLVAAGIGLAAMAAGTAMATRSPDRPVAPAAGPSPAGALSVTLATVALRPLTERVVATGTVSAWREVVVGAESGGLTTVDVLVDEGERVERGQLLARLGDAVLRAQAAGQDAAVAEAESNLAMARTQARNARDLAPLRAMSREEAETRENAVRTATARLDLARASRAETEVRIGQARILAPVSGTVLRRAAVVGALAATGSELFRLLQDNRIEVEAQVPEAAIARVRAGQEVLVTVPGGAAVRGSVRLVTPTVDARTRLGTVRVALPDGSPLRTGMFARVEVSAPATASLSVPERALVWRSGRPGVFRLGADGAVRLATVVTGRRSGGYAEIVSGLAADDRIALGGAGFLNDGDRVRVAVAEAGE